MQNLKEISATIRNWIDETTWAQGLFDNKTPLVIAIVVVIVIFSLYNCRSAVATELEIGATYTGEFNGGIGIAITERVFNGKIDLGIALMGEQEFNGEVTGNNGNVFFAFVAKKPQSWWAVLPSEVSIGAAGWIKTDDRLIGSQLGYMLGLKWRFTKHIGIGIRHWSNAGIVRPNRGQDFPNIWIGLNGSL